MDRQREPDRLLDLVDEAAQAGHPADGRDRGAPVRDPNVREPQRRIPHLVEVEERLAHPHEDEVVDRLEPPKVQHLIEDLGRFQIPAETHRTRRAERARKGAAGLRRDADRAAAVAVAHQHRLDRMPVGGAEERLHRAVRGLRFGLDGERRERNRAGEVVAKGTRQVRHLCVAENATRRPLPHLTDAEGGLTASGEPLVQQGQIHAVTVALGRDRPSLRYCHAPHRGNARRDRCGGRRRRAEA